MARFTVLLVLTSTLSACLVLRITAYLRVRVQLEVLRFSSPIELNTILRRQRQFSGENGGGSEETHGIDAAQVTDSTKRLNV